MGIKHVSFAGASARAAVEQKLIDACLTRRALDRALDAACAESDAERQQAALEALERAEAEEDAAAELVAEFRGVNLGAVQ